MKKILLVQPAYKGRYNSYHSYSPALGILCNFLKDSFQISVHDLLAADNSIGDMRFAEWDAVAMTLHTPAVPCAMELLKKIRSQAKDIPVIAGGPHASFLPDSLLRSGFDYVITGRTGSDALDIFKKIMDGKNKQRIFAGNIKEDDNLHICLDYFDLDKYDEHIFFTSIGCPHKCVFCSNHSSKIYYKNLECLFIEIESASAKKPMPIFFSDDIFIPEKNRFLSFCSMATEMAVPFTVQMRADQITRERVELLAKSGCQRIVMGAESGSDSALNIFGKSISSDIIIKGIRAIEEVGIKTRMNYILGMLGDDQPEESLRRIATAAHPSEISLHQLIPFPGSKLWGNPKKFGIKIINKSDFGEYNFSHLSENFVYKSLNGQSIRKVMENCATLLMEMGYESPESGRQHHIIVTPLSKSHFLT